MEQERYDNIVQELLIKIDLKKRLIENSKELESRYEQNSRGMGMCDALEKMFNEIYDQFCTESQFIVDKLVHIEMQIAESNIEYRPDEYSERLEPDYMPNLLREKERLTRRSNQLAIRINEIGTNQRIGLSMYNAFSRSLPSDSLRRKIDLDINNLRIEIIELRSEQRLLQIELGMNEEEISDSEE